MFLAYGGGLVLASLVLLIDLVIGVLQVTALALTVPLAWHGEETTGHVVKIEPMRPASRVSSRRRVRVAYGTPAGTLETRGTIPMPRVGAPVAVRYDPARPARATTMVSPWRIVGTRIPMVLATAALAIGVIIGSVWYFAGVHSNAQAPLVGGCIGLAIALGSGYYACGRLAIVMRWRRHMTRAPGTVRRFAEHSPVGPGIQVSFRAADGREDFWAQAGSVPVSVGDTVTVYYDPARPAESATVQTVSDVRARAIAATVIALIFLVLAGSVLSGI